MQENLTKKGNHFFYKGKKLIVDLFTPCSFHYEVSGNKVEGKLRMGAHLISLGSCEAIFPDGFLYGGVFRPLPLEVDFKWVEMVYPGPLEVTESRFFKDLEKEKRGMPEVVWKRPPDAPVCSGLPLLLLRERSGVFADLWFDYGKEGRMASHDEEGRSWRPLEEEKGWERDLLETDFVKKQVGSSHYYCPMDRVSKSLTFLLEVGWKVLDYQGKEVHSQGKKELRLVMQEDKIAFQGTIAYASHKADISQVVGAFNRKERFLSLSENSVGLIDLPASWEEVAFQEGASSLEKRDFALLKEFFSDETIDKDLKVQELAERCLKAKRLVKIAPTALFQGNLYPYQQEGLDWLHFLYRSGFAALLADEMGLGKSVQLLSFLSLIETDKPILIVVPTSLIFNWKNECERFLPSFPLYVHTGALRTKDLSFLHKQGVIITSYALLRIDHALLKELLCSVVVLDEAQVIKNGSSTVSQAAYHLQADFRVAITGTPIENSWKDLENIFRFLMPELLVTQKTVQPFLLRRTKEEVALDLPQKIQQTVFVEMEEEQRALYDQMLIETQRGMVEESKKGNKLGRMQVLKAILRLRQMAAYPELCGKKAPSGKYIQLFEDLEEVVASGRKVLVYSQFTTMLRFIEQGVKERDWNYLYLDGSTKNRETLVKQFQEGSSPIFLISLKAGGVGLNLTAADYVFIYDPWWNDAVEEQAIDRAHRLGRQGMVIAKRYLTRESIEEKMMRLKKRKRELSHLLFEGGEEKLSLEELYELLSSSIIS